MIARPPAILEILYTSMYVGVNFHVLRRNGLWRPSSEAAFFGDECFATLNTLHVQRYLLCMVKTHAHT